MAALQGTILASKIVPTDSLDTYATHEDKYGRGGHRSVDTLEERDNITTPRRKEGMTVYVKENKTKYILEGGIDNANWKVDSSGGGSGGEVDLSEYYKKTETYSKVEVDNIVDNIPATDLTNYYNKTQVDAIALDKVDKVAGKGLSTEDFTTAEKTKLSGLSNYVKPISEPISYISGLQTVLDSKATTTALNAEKARIDAILSGAGANVDTFAEIVTLINSVDTTNDDALAGYVTSNNARVGNIETNVTNLTSNKVDKVAGKQLSTEDYTTAEKTKLSGLSNYTLPVASTNTLGGVKAGANITIDANGVINANDTNVSFTEISNKPTNLSGYGITDAYTKTQVDNLIPNISTKQDNLVSGTNIKTINGESVLGSGDIVISSGGSGGGYFTGTAGITVGGITTGDTFTNVPVTDMINNLINPELTPNLTNPNNVLTSTVSGLREIGTSITLRLTATFNRGSISPQYSASEPYRAGLPTKYVFTSTAGLNQEVITNATTYSIDVSSFEVALGTVTFSSNISYSAGPQPTTSKGKVFDNPLPAGNTGNKTVTITGVYPCYNGISTLTKMTLANHGGTITVDAPADMNVGGERFKIQYPAVWSAKTPIVQQENELSKAWDNQNMAEYEITDINISGVPYKQVKYIGSGIGARKLKLVF